MNLKTYNSKIRLFIIIIIIFTGQKSPTLWFKKNMAIFIFPYQLTAIQNLSASEKTN